VTSTGKSNKLIIKLKQKIAAAAQNTPQRSQLSREVSLVGGITSLWWEERNYQKNTYLK